MIHSKSLLSLRRSVTSYSRMMATKVKLVGDLDESLTQESTKDGFSGKSHPGKINNPVYELPNPLQKAISNVFVDQQIKPLQQEAERFSRKLRARFEPSKSSDRRKWSPISYTKRACQVYLIARMAPEFAAVNRVMGEFAKWVPNFTPKTLFDFGSGVGSVPWAALARWGKKLEEIYCVDSSSEMIDLAELLMRGGDKDGRLVIPNTYYKQFLPATANRKFDLVVGAHSLFEFPTLETRLDTIHNLWSKANNYLVLIEQGTTEGFKLIDEAKEFVLFNARKEKTPFHILAPCPHLEPCPRLLRQGDRTPCNFEARYHPYPANRRSQALAERFSFVIIGKGPKPTTIPQWPRLVRDPIVKAKHTVCRMCTPDGKLEEVIFTRSKDGEGSFLCARASEWGDLLPVHVHTKEFTVKDKIKPPKSKPTEDSELF